MTCQLIPTAVGQRAAPALRERGHQVETIDHPLGSGQAVGIDPDTGTRSAAADHRMESVALAY